jgi:carbon storage regulator
MLVLSRKVGEALTIGAEVTIRLIRVNGNQVRLGIEAPESVKVLRAELLTSLDPTSGLHQRSEQRAPLCPSCRKPR